MVLPSQLSIDALNNATLQTVALHGLLSTDSLHTATSTARSRTMHIYRRQMDPASPIEHTYIDYHYTKYISLAQCNRG